MKRKIGKIEISAVYIANWHKYKEILSKIFSEFYPYKIEISDGFDFYIYNGFCDKFKEINELDKIKEYDVIVTYEKDTDCLNIEFKER